LGTGDRFAAYWRALAEKFKDNTYIMGFDMLNEP
jgi:aryl-phospho-beta-D-glucosidase BglC (GH1 family)